MENQIDAQNTELNNEMAQRLAKLDEIRKQLKQEKNTEEQA